MITHDEKLELYQAMLNYGGSFVVALAECFILADEENLRRLCDAFPEIVAQYQAMARHKGGGPRP